MARVTLVLEDATDGRWDGAITSRFTFDPSIPAESNVEDLTQAQTLGLAVHGFLDMQAEKLESKIQLEERDEHDH